MRQICSFQSKYLSHEVNDFLLSLVDTEQQLHKLFSGNAQAWGKSAMGKIQYIPSKVQELLGMCILIRNLAYMRTSLVLP